MGKAALLAVVFGLAILGTRYGFSTQATLNDTRGATTNDQRTVQARSAALAGFSRALHGLSESFTDAAFTGSLDGIDYAVTVDAYAAAEARVVATGSVPTPDGQTQHYTVSATVGDTEQVPAEPPLFMRYGLLADGNVTLSGNAEIVSIGVTDGQASSINASLHTNATLDIGSNSTRVAGFGSYVRRATGHYQSAFVPNYNPDGLTAVSRADHVDIPRIDPDAMAALLPVTLDVPANPLDYWDGFFNGVQLQGGTRENPAVFRIRGNAFFSNVTISGYAIIIAEGRVDLGGTVRATGTGYGGPQESPLAIYTTGEVTMNGGAQAYAQIFANQGLRYQGNVDIWGNLVVGNSFESRGSARIHYIPASPALTRYWDNSLGNGLALIAYAER